MTLRFSFYFLFLLASNQVYCQHSQIDSLKSQYKIETGQTSLKTLNRLCFKYAFNDKDSALHYINKSILIGINNRYDSLLTEAFNIKGIIYDIQGETDSSEYYFLKTYNLSVEKDFKTYESFSTNNLGMMYWRRSDYTEALDFFFKALQFNESNDIIESVGSNYNNIGLIYQEMNLFTKAIEFHRKALNHRLNIHLQKDEVADSYNNLAICFKSFNQLDSAKFYYEKSLENAIINENIQAESIAYAGLSILAFESREYETALEYNLKSREINNFDVKSQLISNSNLSGIYFSLKQYQKGLLYGNMAKDSLEKYETTMFANDSYKFLALNYAAINQPILALEMIAQFEHNIDSAFSGETSEAFSELEVKYETEKKEKLLSEEQYKNTIQNQKLLESELQISNQNKWFYGLLGGSIGLLFLGLFLFQRSRSKAQTEKDRAVIQERDKGIKLILDAQENERKRISKDLHDGIGQQLSGLKMAWSSLVNSYSSSDPELTKSIDQLSEVLTSSADEVRNISHQMMPNALQELGLVAAIEDMLEKAFLYSEVKYSFENIGLKGRMNESIEISLYRISQELINNVIKHSKATEVVIQLIKNKNYILLIIEDNGVGISSEKPNKGNGLMNIETRLNTINGKVNFEGSPQGGTLATIRIILNEY